MSLGIKRTSWGRFMADLKRGPLTVLVWLLAIGAATFLFIHRTRHYDCLGLARGMDECQLSSKTGGRIGSLLVDQYEEVQAGEIVATLDDSLLDARIETTRAAIKRFEGQLATTHTQPVQVANATPPDWEAKLADIDAREEKCRVELLNLRLASQADQSQEQQSELDLKKAHKLVKTQAIDRHEYEAAKLRQSQVGQRLAENAAQVAASEKKCHENEVEREEFVKLLPSLQAGIKNAASLHEAIGVQEAELKELQHKREEDVLRAPVSGRVTQVLCTAGQMVSPGESIVTIGGNQALQVVGYLPEADTTPLREKMPVRIARLNQPWDTAQATIHRLGTGVEQVPPRLWRDPKRPEFGRCFVVSAASPLGLMPGETVLIRLKN